MSRALGAICLALACLPRAGAQAGGLEPIQVTLHPRELPAPALRYRLLPELAGQTPAVLGSANSPARGGAAAKGGAEGGRAPALPLAGLLLPAGEKMFAARARLDRKIAALRCLEAIRLYAAGHGGRLPSALADITEVPIPVDPVTGRPFRYTLAGPRAMLEGLPPAGEKPGPTNALSYVLTMKR